MKYTVLRTSTSNYAENPKINGVDKEILPYKSRFRRKADVEELREVYTIELNSLEELHNFIKECGCHVIISNAYERGFRMPEIEIYDACRE